MIPSPETGAWASASTFGTSALTACFCCSAACASDTARRCASPRPNRSKCGRSHAAKNAAPARAIAPFACRGYWRGNRLYRLTFSAARSASLTAASANGSTLGRTYSAVENFSFSPSTSSIATAAACLLGLR